MNKIYYVVMKIKQWEDVEVESKNFALMSGKLTKSEDGCIGFLMVFDNYDKAKQYDATGEHIVMVREMVMT